MLARLSIAVLITCLFSICHSQLVVTTWATKGFAEATNNAFKTLIGGGSRMLSLVEGLSTCERLQCDTTVGYGGSPDESGETTLDALVIDGPGHKMAAVAQLHRIKDAARVAWAIMNHTKHTMLAGEAATHFALSMGFQETNLTTNTSIRMIESWKKNDCQPNFWVNVAPDPAKGCGPYHPVKNFVDLDKEIKTNRIIDRYNHDTIGMVVVDEMGTVSAGTSTNGARFKIAGRVGDSPIPGSGAYLAEGVGGAAATGDGDVMMRFLPSYQTVEFMRLGTDPRKAARKSLLRILAHYPTFSGAVVAANVKGEHGAACCGMPSFTYSYMEKGDLVPRNKTVVCGLAIFSKKATECSRKMIFVRKAKERGHADHGWLKTSFTFSFADYYDPEWMGFSALRVINEDFIKPTRGFGAHPHRNMEILTYVLEGAIEHKDSMGNQFQIKAGEFQIMSAGTGVIHSEYNPSDSATLHLYQIWVQPNESEIKPRYEQRHFHNIEGRQLVLSPDKRNGSFKVHQDMLLWRWKLTAGEKASMDLDVHRCYWIQVVKGDLHVNDKKASKSDGVGIRDEAKLELKAGADTEILLFDLPRHAHRRQ